MKKPLSPALRRFYGVADMGFSFMTSVETQFFAIFLTDYAMFSLPVSTLIMSITSTFDAIFASLPGVIIDKSNLKWGRYRSWLLIGPPLVVILYPFQYSKIGSETVAAAIICAAFIISHIIWNIFWVSNLSLISVLASNPQERMLLSSHRSLYGSVSRIVFGLFALQLATAIGGVFNSVVSGYFGLALIMAMFMWVCYYVIFRITDGYEPTVASAAGAPAAQKVSFLDMAKVVFGNPPLLFHMLEDLCRGIGSNMVSALAAYYYRYVGATQVEVSYQTLMSTHITAQAIAAFAGAFCVPFVAKIVKDTKSRYMLYALCMSGCLVAARFFGGSTFMFMGFCAAYSFFMTSLAATNPLMYSNTIVYGEYKHGKNLAGLVMGFSNLPLKLGIIMRGISVIGLNMYGFVPNVAQPAEVQSGIVTLMTLIPAIAIGLNVLLCLTLYPLNDKRVAQLQAEIDERKAAAASSAQS